jgi:hypothetical protein
MSWSNDKYAHLDSRTSTALQLLDTLEEYLNHMPTAGASERSTLGPIHGLRSAIRDLKLVDESDPRGVVVIAGYPKTKEQHGIIS